MSGAYTFATIL